MKQEERQAGKSVKCLTVLDFLELLRLNITTRKVEFFQDFLQRIKVTTLFKETGTWTEGHVVDGSIVAVDLLQCCVAAGVPDGGGPVFTARHQQSPRWIQTNGVHLYAGVRQVVLQKENKTAADPSQRLTKYLSR